ncbi:MAG: hypothetical protein Kow0042_22890 [Calditrichia bacterium]
MNGFDGENQPLLKELLSQIQKGNCILFLGAGVHAPPGEGAKFEYPEAERPPLGAKLAGLLAEECHFDEQFPEENQYDLQRVSLCYENTGGLDRNRLVKSLNQYLREGKKPSPVLLMLASLPFKIFVTTNYDLLLESAIRKFDKEPEVFVYNPQHDQPTRDLSSDPTIDRPMVFKMHGDLHHPETIVITDEDYITFIQRMTEKDISHPVPETIRYRMGRWPILFVGYSLRDYNLRLLIRTLRWRIDPANFPSSYSVDRKPDRLIMQVWQNERRFVTFVSQDLWTFVPFLYKEVMGKEWAS